MLWIYNHDQRWQCWRVESEPMLYYVGHWVNAESDEDWASLVCLSKLPHMEVFHEGDEELCCGVSSLFWKQRTYVWWVIVMSFNIHILPWFMFLWLSLLWLHMCQVMSIGVLYNPLNYCKCKVALPSFYRPWLLL